MTIAEESTAWPGVSKPVYEGGLGFGFKWNMGWMNDSLRYMARPPVHRKYHQGEITFSMIYAFHEHFVLVLSHDEVVHGKGSLLNKMPGDDWQKAANLRMFVGWMWGHPGKKLLFQGCEIAQWREWNYLHSIDWHLLDYQPHSGMQAMVRRLNAIYRQESALYALDESSDGFQWIDHSDSDHSVWAFLRKAPKGSGSAHLLVIVNATPVVRPAYKVGVPLSGEYSVIFNSDDAAFGGSGLYQNSSYGSDSHGSHGFAIGLNLDLPPLATMILRCPLA
jgi:1,4-alpha-glucan branching enzyme